MSEFSLATYQSTALATALPTAFNFEYLVPGLCSEVGEILGQRARAARDEWDAERLRREIVKEYGDVCWPTAVALYDMGVLEPNDPRALQAARAAIQDGVDPTVVLLERSFYILSDYESFRKTLRASVRKSLEFQLQVMWYLLRDLCLAVTGESFDYVLGSNAAKLNARKVSGTLTGAGDDR